MLSRKVKTPKKWVVGQNRECNGNISGPRAQRRHHARAPPPRCIKSCLTLVRLFAPLPTSAAPSWVHYLLFSDLLSPGADHCTLPQPAAFDLWLPARGTKRGLEGRKKERWGFSSPHALLPGYSGSHRGRFSLWPQPRELRLLWPQLSPAPSPSSRVVPASRYCWPGGASFHPTHTSSVVFL